VEPHIQLTSIDVIASALEPVIPTLGARQLAGRGNHLDAHW